MNLKKDFNPSINHWYDAPPKIIQNIGDALTSASVFILGYVALGNEHNWLAITGIVMGILGIMITKIFKVNGVN